MLPSGEHAVGDLTDAGDKVVCRWSASGTHKGELRGIAPTGNKIQITGITICRLSNGKIAEQWVVWDCFGMMQQLGVVPKTEKLGRAA